MSHIRGPYQQHRLIVELRTVRLHGMQQPRLQRLQRRAGVFVDDGFDTVETELAVNVRRTRPSDRPSG